MSRSSRNRSSSNPSGDDAPSRTIVVPEESEPESQTEEGSTEAAVPEADASARADALEEVAKELDEVRRLAGELTSVLEQTIQRAQQVDEISKDTMSELLVLLTAVRPLQAVGVLTKGEPPAIDEYIEDMIDPEFGLRPARKAITRAADRILNGYDAFRFPQSAVSSDEPADS